MKQGSTLFLRVVLLLIGALVLSALIFFPQTEGRAQGLDLVGIYSDPFIIYIYIAFAPFFIALHQAFKLLGYIDKNKIFSDPAIKAIRNVKYCATAIVAFIALALGFIVINQGNSDDIAGGVAMGLFIIFGSTVIAAAAAVLQRVLQNAVDIKSENDLTV